MAVSSVIENSQWSGLERNKVIVFLNTFSEDCGQCEPQVVSSSDMGYGMRSCQLHNYYRSM